MSVQDAEDSPRESIAHHVGHRMTPDLSHVDASKLQQYKLAFNHFDRDGSGCIDVEELRQVFALISIFPDEEELEELVCEFDSNQNGNLEFPEFVSMLETKEGNDALSRATLIKAFQALDSDASGFISSDELMSYMMRVRSPGFNDNHAQEMMVAADANGDGEIDYEEFSQFLMSNGGPSDKGALDKIGHVLDGAGIIPS